MEFHPTPGAATDALQSRDLIDYQYLLDDHSYDHSESRVLKLEFH